MPFAPNARQARCLFINYLKRSCKHYVPCAALFPFRLLLLLFNFSCTTDMEHPYNLVAPQLLSRRARLSRALAVSVVCVALVVLVCGYHAYAPLSAPTSLLLRDGIPTDREIEFESAVRKSSTGMATVLTLMRRWPSAKVPKQP
jgi:hypothetical protein